MLNGARTESVSSEPVGFPTRVALANGVSIRTSAILTANGEQKLRDAQTDYPKNCTEQNSVFKLVIELGLQLCMCYALLTETFSEELDMPTEPTNQHGGRHVPLFYSTLIPLRFLLVSFCFVSLRACLCVHNSCHSFGSVPLNTSTLTHARTHLLPYSQRSVLLPLASTFCSPILSHHRQRNILLLQLQGKF